MTKDGNDHEFGSEIVTTKSVTSAVVEGGEQVSHADIHEGRVEPYGHMMLMDWDDLPEHVATSRAGTLPGVSVVTQSSPESFHCWNMSVADLKTTACRLVLNEDDPAHIRAGIKRGYWRLRYTAKRWNYDDSIYKSAPELVTVTVNETDREQSRPHWALARSLYDIPEIPMSGFEWVGHEVTEEEYETMTDREKDRFNGDDDGR